MTPTPPPCQVCGRTRRHVAEAWAEFAAAHPAPAPTGERPDTDAIYDELMAQARKGCCDDRRRPCVYHDTYSDGTEAAPYVIDRAGEVPRG